MTARREVGPRSEEIVAREQRHIAPGFQSFALYSGLAMARGQGSTLIDEGPGKIDLLRAVSETGSISAAARVIGMSYKRAWFLIDTLNRGFGEPVVEALAGGNGGGGARLTASGRGGRPALFAHGSELPAGRAARRRRSAAIARAPRTLTPAPLSPARNAL